MPSSGDLGRFSCVEPPPVIFLQFSLSPAVSSPFAALPKHCKHDAIYTNASRADGRHQFERTILRLRQVIYHLPALPAPKRCRNQEKVLARASGSTQSWTQRPSEIREGYQYQKTRSYTSAVRLKIPQQRQRT